MRMILALLLMGSVANAGYIDVEGTGGTVNQLPGGHILGDVQVQTANAVGTLNAGTFTGLGDLRFNEVGFQLTDLGNDVLDGVFTSVNISHPGLGYTFLFGIGDAGLNPIVSAYFGIDQVQSAALTITVLDGVATSTDLTINGINHVRDNSVVPEPSSILLCGAGMFLAFLKLRK